MSTLRFAISYLPCLIELALSTTTLQVATATVGVAASDISVEADHEPAEVWQVSRGRCLGSEEEAQECPDLPSCGRCTPVDCALGDWEDWVSGGVCTGLKERHRSVKKHNNECGKPCSGTLVETDEAPSCVHRPEPCVWWDWGDWSSCRSGGQSGRSREIKSDLAHSGKPCEGASVETRPCLTPPQPINCTLTDWSDWAECSVSCDEGRRTRLRRIAVSANYGGEPCNDTIMEADVCQVLPCDATASCDLSSWSEWEGCETPKSLFKRRFRKVASSARENGDKCDDSLDEVVACDDAATRCSFSSWASWSSCDRACGGGQQFRSRRQLTVGIECPITSLSEAKTCAEKPCQMGKDDCLLTSWTKWSPCSAKCGVGQQTRSRKVKSDMKVGGVGCLDALLETRPCPSNTPCAKEDCEWDSWEAWSGCTCTCDGGTRTRNLKVKVAPKNGGKYCHPRSTSQVEPCNTKPCFDLNHTDGQFHKWSSWSSCSTSCGGGVKTRSRTVAEMASPTGQALHGWKDDLVPCNTQKCDDAVDCELNEWLPWTECSCTCFGHQERTRTIATYARRGGRECDASMRQARQCNPRYGSKASAECGNTGITPNCSTSEWTDWSGCSATCGGGQGSRARKLLNSPCVGSGDSLMDFGPCNTMPCERRCVDCKVGDWSDWSACTKCGGQKTRSRVILEYPNECGQPCEQTSLNQADECPMTCDVFFCAWTDWTVGECSTSCGPATMARDRYLRTLDGDTTGLLKSDYLFKGGTTQACAGLQSDILPCNTSRCPDECTPVDCEFGDWGDWENQACQGLCLRSRTKARENNECGRPCDGVLSETKACAAKCEVTADCTFTQWGPWSICRDLGQRTRFRDVLMVAFGGGKSCGGFTKETEPCGARETQKDCLFGDWNDWQSCPVTCGGATAQRSRYIMQGSEGDFAKGCTGSLTQLEPCGTGPCDAHAKPVNSEVSDWTDWSACSADGQKIRKRWLEKDAQNGGLSFSGATLETDSCPLSNSKCLLSDWSDWDLCDRTCGGGQRLRHRLELSEPGDCRVVSADIVQTQPCNIEVCDPLRDCGFGHWSAWSECSKSCGFGQQARSRSPARYAKLGGEGCQGMLGEVKGCSKSACVASVDCKWGAWEPWTACSCSCGGGSKTRSRRIETFSLGDGKLCHPGGKNEVHPCNTHSCEKCIDGKWSPWSEWTQCSASCGGGVTWRHRNVARMARGCGEEPYGVQQNYKPCSQDKSCGVDADCKWRQWSDWSDCTSRCDGTKRRNRDIASLGVGSGKGCSGAAEEVAGCNSAGKEGCQVAEPVDCKLSTWGMWSECSTTCGPGSRSHSRIILTPSANGGKSCAGNLSKLSACETKDCGDSDCVWNEWHAWGACTKCSGQKFRTRTVKKYNSGTGKPCEPGAATEVGACDERFCETPSYCGWGEWKEWSDCTATCGSGSRHRKRHLEVSSSSATSLSEENEDLQRQIQFRKKSGEQQLLISFGAGAVTLMLALGSYRLVSRRSGRAQFSRIDSIGVDGQLE